MKKAVCLLLFLCALFSCASAEKGDFSPRLRAALAADRALEQKYGLSRDMLDYFIREVTEAEDGFTVTYTGMDDFSWVLGAYTVTVREEKTQARWSHEGMRTAGGFEAEVWGREQLSEMLRIVEETSTMQPFQAIAKGREKKHPQADADPPSLPEPCSAPAEIRLTRKEMELLARRAVIDGYDLTVREAVALKTEEWNDPEYYKIDGRVCRMIPVRMEIRKEHAPQFWVYVDVENGEIQDIHYLSDRSGNG